ncbi:MAG: tellurium resistance protein TerZ [Micavibrio sp.]|nr:MAG: tellurium resistance protein TerZ [Micavibrio sp.]
MTLPKGDHGPLNVTQKARHRIMAGLGWDPAGKAKLSDKIEKAMGGKKTHHDLDLACFVYDSHNTFISVVSPNQAQDIDASGKIYHSGDNVAGFGDGDDEQVSVELKDLPTDIHHILFIAKIQTGHDFYEVADPEIHLTDGFSNDTLLETPINHEEGHNKDVFVFAHIYRSGESWQLHHVAEYLCSEENEQWHEELSRFLTIK